MRKFATIATGLVLSLSLGAAAFAQDTTVPPVPETPAVEAPAAAPAPEATPAPEAAPAATPATAGAEKGKIYFFRPGRLPGAVYTYYVVETGEDGKSTKENERLGGLPNGGGFVLEVEEGVHNFNIRGPMADNRASDRLRMDVEAGQTYYVEMTFRMGALTSGFALVPADEARFVKSKAKLDKGKKE